MARPLRTRLAAVAALLASLVGPTPFAAAQDARTLDVQRFRPAPDRYGFLGIPGTRTPGPWAWNVSLFVDYASEPLTFRRLADDARLPVIRHRVGADVIAQLGILDRVAVVLDAPMVLYQSVDDELLGDDTAVSAMALRDPYAAVRVRVLGEGAPPEHAPPEGAGLALQVATTLPFGLENEFAGEGAPQLEATALGDFHFLDFGLAAMAGYRHRFGEPSVLGVRFRNEIFAGLALKTPTILVANLSALFEVRATTALDDEAFQSANTAVEGEAGLRWAEGDVALTWAVGMGFSGGVGTPGFRGIFGVELAPRTHDLDGDGLVDDEDECRHLPEDLDGVDDADGCPDPDNDGDLIPDEDDRCPDEAADLERDADEDGCPDPVTDADDDGIVDDVDACPERPEDRDGWRDEDGCPDPDDDHDGIPDAEDDCRREAEDRDGFEDADGCPDPDDDGDGVPDAEDACPRTPEDADGHADEDGCPDPDDDRDGVLDADDACPGERETIDGTDDDDGCPDAGGRARWRPFGEAPEGELPGLRGRVRFAGDGSIRGISRGAIDQLARHLLARWGARWRVSIGVDEAAARAALTAALTERGVPAARFVVASDDALGAAEVRVERLEVPAPAPPQPPTDAAADEEAPDTEGSDERAPDEQAPDTGAPAPSGEAAAEP
ncbi:MAG TPA: hypothetical protein RMH99_15285 [Sandaracinaceae bacterium LLY-WYZ-13_1]|nr:hypothetical protein [Sandaracinaceae bacterium LLY-WYZ-13_1]